MEIVGLGPFQVGRGEGDARLQHLPVLGVQDFGGRDHALAVALQHAQGAGSQVAQAIGQVGVQAVHESLE